MKLEQFKKYMESFKKLCDDEVVLNDALQNMSPDFGGYYCENMHSLIIDLLEDIMNDDSQWIEYFIYELDWGKDYKQGYVTDEGKNIPLSTIEDLYNLLKNRKG